MNNKIIFHSKLTIGKEEIDAVKKILQSDQLSQGKYVIEFEKIIKDYHHRKYAIAVNSGTSALYLSLLALNTESEVIIPSFTCEFVLRAVLMANLKPKIVDTFKDIKKAVTKTTKCIILPYNITNQFYDLEEIFNLKVPIIEDCAVAIGSKYAGKPLGSFGDISVFSFYATKMITSCGEGGMVLTDNKKIYNKIRETREYNFKMTDVQAAMGIVQFRKLDQFIRKRECIAEKYDELLDNNLWIKGTNCEYNFYRYIWLDKNADKVRKLMRENNIFCGKIVRRPLHRILNLSKREYPHTEFLIKHLISFPIYPSLSLKDVDYICKSYRKYGRPNNR